MRITRSQLGDAALAIALVVIGILGTAAACPVHTGALADRPVVILAWPGPLCSPGLHLPGF